MKRTIRQLVAYYKNKFKTSDPFELADLLNIEVQIGDLGLRAGCYMYLKRHKCVFLNEHLDRHEMKLVMAHELGHAVLHPKENCYFIRNKTLLLNSRTEIEANKFAMELLISDDILEENKTFTTEQLSRLLGYEQGLIDLRIKSYYDLS